MIKTLEKVKEVESLKERRGRRRLKNEDNDEYEWNIVTKVSPDLCWF